MEKLALASRRLRQETLVSLSVGIVFQVTRERVAWRGTRSKHHFLHESLTCTLDQAKTLAESWRTQGSQFVIMEIPALSLLTESQRIVITDIRSWKPFAGWSGQLADLKRGTPVLRTLRSLGPQGSWDTPVPPLPGSVYYSRAGRRERLTSLMGRDHLFRWRSEVFYRDSLFDWDRSGAPRVADGVRELRRTYLRANRPSRS